MFSGDFKVVLMKVAVIISKTSVTFHHTSHDIPEYSHVYTSRRENLKCHHISFSPDYFCVSGQNEHKLNANTEIRYGPQLYPCQH
jgi:hypothetical protein